MCVQRRDTRRVAARTARHSRLTHACDLATKVSVLNVFEKKKTSPKHPGREHSTYISVGRRIGSDIFTCNLQYP